MHAGEGYQLGPSQAPLREGNLRVLAAAQAPPTPCNSRPLLEDKREIDRPFPGALKYIYFLEIIYFYMRKKKKLVHFFFFFFFSSFFVSLCKVNRFVGTLYSLDVQ